MEGLCIARNTQRAARGLRRGAMWRPSAKRFLLIACISAFSLARITWEPAGEPFTTTTLYGRLPCGERIFEVLTQRN